MKQKLCLLWAALLLAGLLAACGQAETALAPRETEQTPGAPAESPAPEEQKLVFAEDSGGFASGIADVIGPANSTVGYLNEEEIAAVWGENAVVWDGIAMGEQAELNGVVVYEESGEPWLLEITARGQWLNGGGEGYLLCIEMAPGRFPPSCFGAESFSPNCSLWDTDVLAWAPKDSETGETVCFSVAFLRGGEEPVGVRGYVTSAGMAIEEETARAWIAAFTTQCLKPGNFFSLAPLRKAPQETPAPLVAAAAPSPSPEEERTFAEAAAALAEDELESFGVAGRLQNLRITHLAPDGEGFLMRYTLEFAPQTEEELRLFRTELTLPEVEPGVFRQDYFLEVRKRQGLWLPLTGVEENVDFSGYQALDQPMAIGLGL